MASDTKIKIPESLKLKSSRVVLISCLLTFLFIVEFCIGVRSVYHVFVLRNTPYYVPSVSWVLCAESLFISIVVTFVINIISAMWEQKNLKEDEKLKNAVRFSGHILIGGIIYRYIYLWFCDQKNLQKRESLLLAMSKFLFTQFFTIPLIIIHLSLIESLDDMIYDVFSILCVAINLVFLYTVFDWCLSELEELKTWNYETINLVPLVFFQTPIENVHQNSDTVDGPSTINEQVEKDQNSASEMKDDVLDALFLRLLIFLQTFTFTLGRLLSLGVLLKLAGIYAVSVMFLKLLLSVVYLKFQAPFLASDSLPKWRQLIRLTFMGYILIFEWYLNKESKSGYDFTSDVKHGVIFYIIAIVESMFYFASWGITESYYSDIYFGELYIHRSMFVHNVILIGILSMVFSLIFHFLVVLWQFRKFNRLAFTVRRFYFRTKLKMSSNSSLRWFNRRNDRVVPNRQPAEISSPVILKIDAIDCLNEANNTPNLENQNSYNSYKDLREPLDDGIEIYARKNSEIDEKCPNEKENECDKICYINESTTTCMNENISNFEENYKFEKILHEKRSGNCGTSDTLQSNTMALNKNIPSFKKEENDKIVYNSSNITTKIHIDTANKETKLFSGSIDVKSKMSEVSESITGKWNKMSLLFKKTSETVREHLEKRKEYIMNFRKPASCSEYNDQSSSATTSKNSENISYTTTQIKPKKIEYLLRNKSLSTDSVSFNEDSLDSQDCFDASDQNFYIPEDGNEGDERHYISDYNAQVYKSQSMGDLSEESHDIDQVHQFGNKECSCYVCTIFGGSRVFIRRRSSSLPPETRKHNDQNTVPRLSSTPILKERRGNETNKSDKENSYIFLKKCSYSLSLYSSPILRERCEHELTETSQENCEIKCTNNLSPTSTPIIKERREHELTETGLENDETKCTNNLSPTSTPIMRKRREHELTETN